MWSISKGGPYVISLRFCFLSVGADVYSISSVWLVLKGWGCFCKLLGVWFLNSLVMFMGLGTLIPLNNILFLIKENIDYL